MTPTVPDGPDTELAAAIDWFRADEAMIRDLEAGDAGFMAQHHAADIVRAVLARPGLLADPIAPGGQAFRIGDVVRIVRVARGQNVTPPHLVGRTGTVIHVGVATANVTLPGSDGGLHVLAQDELRLARPAAGRDLTAQDVDEAVMASTDRNGEALQSIADHLNRIARPAVARTDGQPPADGVAPPRCDPAAGTHVLPHRGCILR